MNGLEAIELMKQGKTMMKYGGELYRIIDNNVRVQVAYGAPWEIEVSFDFFATYVEYQPKATGWERKERERYYYVNSDCYIFSMADYGTSEDNRVYDKANYFSTVGKAKEINFKQELFRKLQRFSDENGGSEIDWSDYESTKYHIYFDYEGEGVVIGGSLELCDFGQVHFYSQEVAEEAIEVFKEDLVKYFTHDWSKGE